jgi:hypothetical protein
MCGMLGSNSILAFLIGSLNKKVPKFNDERKTWTNCFGWELLLRMDLNKSFANGNE